MQRLSVSGWVAASAIAGLLTASVALAQPFSSATVLGATRPDAGESFGSGVVLDRDTLVVSSPSSDGGYVYLYERDPVDRDLWSLARRHSPPEACDARSVDLSGDTLVVGGCQGGCASEGSGTVFVYERNKGGVGNWGLFQTIRADNPEPIEHAFGAAVAVEGNVMAIGDHANRTVRMYERASASSGGWVETGRLQRLGLPDVGAFGSVLEISGGTLAVSTANRCTQPFDDVRSEGAYTFERDETAEEGWRETRHLEVSSIDGLTAGAMALEGPTLMFNRKNKIEVHERDHRGLKRWGQRQALDGPATFAVRGRTAVVASDRDEGTDILVHDRFGIGRTPWIVTDALFESGPSGFGVATDAAVGPREIVVGYGGRSFRSEAESNVVIYHRGPIHADGFESGDLGLWDMSKRKVGIAEPGLGASFYALEAFADGKGKKSFVRTRSPQNEPMISLGFTLNANDVGLGAEDIEVLRLSGGGKKNLTLTLRERKGKYRVSLWARHNSGELLLIGELDVPRRNDVRLLVEWQRATGDGHGNGVARLTRLGFGSVESTSLATDRLSIADIKLGFPAGAKGTAGGSYLVDDIALHQ